MDCFNHEGVAAVGTCQYCSKGVCHECIEEVNSKLACKSTCVELSKQQNRFLNLLQQSVEKTSGAYRSYGHFSLIAGLLFIGMGILPGIMGKGWGASVFALLGCAFIYGAISNYENSKRIKTDEET